MVKIVIFDADGVLINGDYFLVHLEKDFGITQDQTRYFFENVFPDCIVGKKELKTELKPYLKDWGWGKSIDEFLDYWHRMEHNIEKDLVDYIQVLREKGIICCLATNQNRYRFNYMLKEMGFAQCFDRVYASDFLGYKKPDIKFYEKVFEDLRINSKKEVLFWDDRLENIEAAREFGIHAELYTTFSDFQTRMKNYL